MNGIEKILERLSTDVQKEIDDVLLRAQQEADAISSRYAAQADLEKRELMEKGRLAAEERCQRLVSVAQMEAKKDILSAKQDMINRAFALAQDKLRHLPEAEYVSLLAELAKSASVNGRESLIFSAKDRKDVGEKVVAAANTALEQAHRPAALSLSEETRELGGGVLLTYEKMEVNCSFDALLRSIRSDLAGEVAGILFS